MAKCAAVSNLFKIETSSWFKSQRSNEDDETEEGQDGNTVFMKQVNELSGVMSYFLTLQFLETFVGTELEIIIFKRNTLHYYCYYYYLLQRSVHFGRNTH